MSGNHLRRGVNQDAEALLRTQTSRGCDDPARRSIEPARHLGARLSIRLDKRVLADGVLNRDDFRFRHPGRAHFFGLRF